MWPAQHIAGRFIRVSLVEAVDGLIHNEILVNGIRYSHDIQVRYDHLLDDLVSKPASQEGKHFRVLGFRGKHFKVVPVDAKRDDLVAGNLFKGKQLRQVVVNIRNHVGNVMIIWQFKVFG